MDILIGFLFLAFGLWTSVRTLDAIDKKYSEDDEEEAS